MAGSTTTVLDKVLRDGVTRVGISIEPDPGRGEDPATTLGYWLAITWPGQARRKFKSSPHKIQSPPAPGITHAIRVPDATGKWVTMGLTSIEAAGIGEACEAWVNERRARKDAERAAAEAAARAAAPGAETFRVSDPYGYLCGTGETARLRDGRAVTALAFSRRYFREDGMSFGAADDAGYVYYTEVREATGAERAALEAREAKATEREALRAQAFELAGAPDGEVPAETPELAALPGARVEPGRGAEPESFGAEGCYRHLRLDEPGGFLWVLDFNGGDGDDWSASNYRSYRARRLPLSPERAALFASLTDAFGAIGARRG